MKEKKYVKGLSVNAIARRVYDREDNKVYKLDAIKEILTMYFEECENALENGEKIRFNNLGSIAPVVHAPITFNIHHLNNEDGNNNPYTTLKFISGDVIKAKMNRKYRKNIKEGFPGLGEYCKCTTSQIHTLIDKGLLKPEGNYNDEDSE